jgi:hypothetical protein
MNDRDFFYVPFLQQWQDFPFDAGLDGEIGDHLAYFFSVRPACQCLLLRSFHLSGRHHLHGADNLCGTVDASDAAA